jgi:prolyl-tRNA synthetase
MMGGKIAHEFMYLNPIGEDTLMVCDNCAYSANRQIAVYKKQLPIEESELPLEKVATPGCKTIEDLAMFLSIPTNKTAKAVFMIATIVEGKERMERFVFVIVRGDMDVNETKLATVLHAIALRPAVDVEIRAIGAAPGYASPVGLQDVMVVVDDIIPHSANLVSGANIEGYHFRNVNYGRDYLAQIVADISMAKDGDACIECGHPLHSIRGVEVGNIFKLGTWISEAMGCNYLDHEGKSHPIVMGSYGIGSGRLLACIAEEHHDEYGLMWPISVSPFQIHLVVLPWKAKESGGEGKSLANTLYQQFNDEQLECLYDDREESPGIKFNDADLIGNPIRITISERSIKNGGVEYKRRDKPDKSIIPLENILPVIKNEIKILESQD